MSCQHQTNRLVKTTPDVPGYLYECEDEPTRPPSNATQKDAAAVIILLREAVEDCKERLHEIRDIIAGNK